MIGYKIHYGEYGHDCWGVREWYGWFDYENKIYTNKDQAIKVMEDAKEQFPYHEFEIYEVEIE